MRFSLYLGLLVYVGTVLSLYAQDITALQERLIAKKEDYQIQAAKLSTTLSVSGFVEFNTLRIVH